MHEWRQKVHNFVGGDLEKLVMAQIFAPGHPYHPRRAAPDDVEAVKLAHVQWFAQETYRPERATVVVTGALDVPQTLDWLTRYFGAVRASGTGTPRPTPPPPPEPLTRNCRVLLADDAVDDHMVVTWVAPMRDSEDAAVLDVVSALLVGPRGARLTRALTDEEGPASRVGIERDERELASLFSIEVGTRAKHDAEDLLPRIDEELGALARGGLTQAELDVARAYVMREARLPLHPLMRADALIDSPERRSSDLRVYERTDIAAVERVVARWLDPRRRVVALITRDGRIVDKVRCQEVPSP